MEKDEGDKAHLRKSKNIEGEFKRGEAPLSRNLPLLSRRGGQRGEVDKQSQSAR